jgi:hypothetical protein
VSDSVLLLFGGSLSKGDAVSAMFFLLVLMGNICSINAISSNCSLSFNCYGLLKSIFSIRIIT